MGGAAEEKESWLIAMDFETASEIDQSIAWKSERKSNCTHVRLFWFMYCNKNITTYILKHIKLRMIILGKPWLMPCKMIYT